MVQPHITYLKVDNFKSFSNLDIELNKFNVVIGANASGKSNFVQIFNFLKNIKEYGLDNAFSLQGGIEYTRNFKENMNKNLKIKLEISLQPTPIRVPLRSKAHQFFYNSAKWEFELEMGKRAGFKIIKDVWDFNVQAIKKEYLKENFQINLKIFLQNKHLKEDWN